MKTYELLTVFKPNLDADEVDKEIKKIENVLLMNVQRIMMEKKFIIFMENILGNLSEKVQGQDREEKWSDLWYIFKPNGFNKTLAEMSSEERENRRIESYDDFSV